MQEKVLFICPNIAGFYQEVIDEMITQGYNVDYIYDEYKEGDPSYNRGMIRHYSCEERKRFANLCRNYWETILADEKYNKAYDILFVIDGKGLHEILFLTLRKRNPHIKTINYLFDTIRSLYHFEHNFQYFDTIYTFDKQDSQEYSIGFLPICWPKLNQDGLVKKYKFFAMGTYFPSRYKIFEFIGDISSKCNLHSYIKLYSPKTKCFFLHYIWKKIRNKKNKISLSEYYSKYMSHTLVPHSDFFKVMAESDIVVDTINPLQDGLTARCTWALGNEKKIITNNVSIATYDFYTPDQVYIIHDFSQKTKKEIESFMDKDFYMTEENRKKIAEFRIDNWLKTLLFSN